MADFNSSLPVRTETAGDVIVRVGDATIPSQQLAIDSSGRVTILLRDGSGNSVTSQASGGQRALDVGINVGGVQVDPRGIRALTSSDVVTAAQGTPGTNANAWFVHLTDGTNNTTVLATGELSVAVGQPLPAGANNVGKVSIQDSSGTAFSVSNPLPVLLSSSAPGTYVNSYHTTSALAAGASVNHDYSVTSSKTLTARKFWASASGKLKAEIQTSPNGSVFTTFWVGFNSTSMPNISIDLDNIAIQDVGTGATVRIILTNKDSQAEDVYSTISGTEL